MYAQLDTIIFEPLNGFTGISETEEAIYAEHPLIAGKSRLQGSGNGLREMAVGIRLHREFINLPEALATIRALLREHRPAALFWGNGQVEGYFVITSLSMVTEHQDPQGNTYAVGLTLTLREYPTAGPKDAQEQQAQKQARARASNNPATAAPGQPAPTCKQNVASSLTIVQREARKVNDTPVFTNLSADTNKALKSAVKRVVAGLGRLKAIATNSPACIDNDSSFAAAIDPALTAATALDNTIPVVSLPAYYTANNQFQPLAAALVAAGRRITLQTSSRNA